MKSLALLLSFCALALAQGVADLPSPVAQNGALQIYWNPTGSSCSQLMSPALLFDANFYLCGSASTYALFSGASTLTLTTTGTSGAATYSGGVLNIPQYSGGGSPTCSVGTYNFGACEVKTIVTSTNSAFTSASTSALVSLFTLPAYSGIVGTYVKHTTQFAQSGGSISTLTAAITDTGASDYSYPFEVFAQAVSATTFWMDGGMANKTTASETVSANFVSNANLGSGSATYLTAGSVTITVRYVPLLLP